MTGPGKCRGTTLSDDGTKQAAIAVDSPLCERCTEHVHRIIEGIDADWDALQCFIGLQRRTNNAVKVAYTPEPGVLINVDIDAKQGQLLELLDLAADYTSQRTGIDHTPPTDRRDRVTAAATLAATHLDALLNAPADWVMRWDSDGELVDQPARFTTLPDGSELDGRGHRHYLMSGTDIALELWELHTRIRGLFGGRKQDQRQHYPMPCHGCGTKSLYRRYGTDLIHCIKCPPRSEPGRGWTQDQYDRLAGLTRFHLKVKEQDEMRELEEQKQRAEDAEGRAARLESQLLKVAQFAGHDSIDQLMAVIDG